MGIQYKGQDGAKRPEPIIMYKVAETHKSMPDEMTHEVDLGPEGNEIMMERN